MYVIPLSTSPDLERYERLARDLQTACESGGADAIHAWAEQIAVGQAESIVERWQRFSETNGHATTCTSDRVQLFVALIHGFAAWPDFTEHLAALTRADSPVSHYEAAVEAITRGDADTLGRLLIHHPELARMRSTREHGSTLLHYVSANGVENFRQKTPSNIVGITKLLLDAGADVNAESNAYGGRSTTLGLTATSCHPENAGVQIPLMELLISYGAAIDSPDGGSAVNACLHNGRGQAAGFLAGRGAKLDLEGAAGVGRLDVVQSFFNPEGDLRSPASREQMHDGFGWACEFGRTSVVDFLLERGVKPDAKLRHSGETGLHWAAYGGHPDIVSLLLGRGASINAIDDRHSGKPLDWALHGMRHLAERDRAESDSWYDVIAQLARAGAKLDTPWRTDNDKLRAALRGGS